MNMLITWLIMALLPSPTATEQMLFRIAEIEVHPEYLDAYLAILNEEAQESVEKELGVIAIFPMLNKDHLNKESIVEMYKNESAYRFHLSTPHFLHYKSATLHMIKSLKLLDMDATAPNTLTTIFRKIDLAPTAPKK